MAPTTDALHHRGALMAARAQRVQSLPWGDALADDDLPRVLDPNVVRVTRMAGELTPEALIAACDRLQDGREFRYLEIWDEPTAERLLPALEARGFESEPILLMAYEGTPAAADGATETGAAEELGQLREEWLRHDVPGDMPDRDGLIRQILQSEARMRSTIPWRAFCVREGGRPAAMAWLLGEGRTQMVEDVYVTPAARGRGLGAAVVNAAVSAAREGGAQLVWLPTDANGLARLFYRRLGWRELSVVSRFLRRQT